LTSHSQPCEHIALFGAAEKWVSMHSQRIEVTLDTVLESVDVAEEIALRVAGEAGFDEDDCHKIGMSVREGVINAYSYGNRQEHGRKIVMIIELEERRLVVHIRDEGENFSLADVPDPLAEENLLRTSGRGIFLMRAFMDEFDIQRGPHGGTELVMSKWFPPSTSGSSLTTNPSASR
jgi:serine/threonine-protein kinase RsbW